MDIFKQYGNVIAIVAVLVIAFIGYTIFFAPKDEAALTEETVAASGDQDLIALLLELKAIELDETIFTNAAFMSLEDFSQELVTEPVGRVNPFAPLPGQPKKTQ